MVSAPILPRTPEGFLPASPPRRSSGEGASLPTFRFLPLCQVDFIHPHRPWSRTAIGIHLERDVDPAAIRGERVKALVDFRTLAIKRDRDPNDLVICR